MFNKSIIILCLAIISIGFAETQEYVLKDGTKLKGSVLSESDPDLVVQTNFGSVTIKKSDLVLKEFNVKMLSGDVFKGTKQKETETEIHLLTNIGLLKLTKINISSIEEVGKVTSTGYVHNKRPRSIFGFLNSASLGKNSEFSLGEIVVYPKHGVGEIVKIESMEISSIKTKFYVVKMEQGKLTIRVPLEKEKEVGLRKICNKKTISEVFEVLKLKPKIRRLMWSRRAQEYDAKIFSGDPIKISEVVRDFNKVSPRLWSNLVFLESLSLGT